jgi:hypothetical protein
MEAEGWKLQDVWAGTTSTTMRLAGLWLLYRIALALYNISPFHPLARFPGPKLAAMTFLYEFWYEGIRWGKYTWEIERMHEKYGASLHVHFGCTIRCGFAATTLNTLKPVELMIMVRSNCSYQSRRAPLQRWGIS